MANKKLKKILGVCVATSMLSVSDGSHLVSGNMLDVYGQAPIEDNSAGDDFDPSKEDYAEVYGPAPVEKEDVITNPDPSQDEKTDVYEPTPEDKDDNKDKFDPSKEYAVPLYASKDEVVPTVHDPKVIPVADIGTVHTDIQSNASYEVTATGTNATVSYTGLADKTITEVVIPDTITINETTYKVTKITEDAFRGNKNLTSVALSDNITAIPSDAFNGCTKLKKVTIGKNVTTIGANAFKNCKNIKTITIKSKKLNAKKIAKNAFKGVKSKSYAKVKVYVPSKKYVKIYKELLTKNGLTPKVKIAK